MGTGMGQKLGQGWGWDGDRMGIGTGTEMGMGQGWRWDRNGDRRGMGTEMGMGQGWGRGQGQKWGQGWRWDRDGAGAGQSPTTHLSLHLLGPFGLLLVPVVTVVPIRGRPHPVPTLAGRRGGCGDSRH